MRFHPMSPEEINTWYNRELTKTFVPQECKPLPDIFELIASKRYEIWGLFEDDDALLGYAALWTPARMSKSRCPTAKRHRCRIG